MGNFSCKAFASDIAVKSTDAIKLHQEQYNSNTVISHSVVASEYLTDCLQGLFFQQETLIFGKLAFNGFYPLLIEGILNNHFYNTW